MIITSGLQPRAPCTDLVQTAASSGATSVSGSGWLLITPPLPGC